MTLCLPLNLALCVCTVVRRGILLLDNSLHMYQYSTYVCVCMYCMYMLTVCTYIRMYVHMQVPTYMDGLVSLCAELSDLDLRSMYD